MIRALLIASCLFTAATGARAVNEQPVTIDTLAAPLKSYLAGQCESHRLAASIASKPADIEATRQGVAMTCDCLFAQVDQAITKLKTASAGQTIAKDAFSAAMNVPMNVCAAQQVRQAFLARCRKSDASKLSSEQLAFYCSCMETELGKLSDVQIDSDAITANQRFQAKVKARMNGQPYPTFEPTATEAVERSCKAAAL